ncbi:MAG TPA: hypothetical protein VMG10_23870 [Gemmataceae bacterium]|nr:hypothetical protein [Gemmataceae bacterium]
MKRIFGVALLVLPLLVGSARATNGWPFNVQAGGSFYIKGGPGPCCPQAGPWYLYWPLEAHFVAPAPTGYPYWPAPQGLPNISFGGPTCPPGVPAPPVAPAPLAPAPAVLPAPPVATAPVPAIQTNPQPAAPPAPQAPPPPASPQLQLPPYLQPTSYYAPVYSGQPPSYWYDR